jgi:Tol biopolymer transport system component
VFLGVLCFSLAQAQEDFPHPELVWKTIETEHFLVHFHEGAEWTARKAAEIAERIYGPITELYQHKPDQRVSIVIRDYDDYSNGAAYFYDNKIDIWAPALDFELRGTHPWIENVVTHEFTHIVQIQTAMKLGRRVPAIYFQWLGYEAERRPDVLYGFPNVIVSYPFSAFVVPTWFAEGVAQYNHPDFSYDRWDTHRDMILRCAILDDKVLSWEEMAVFGKTSLGNEQSYNAGYSFVAYIAEQYGVEKLREISRNLGSLHRLTVSGAIEAVIGKTGEELYEEWKEVQRARYLAMLKERGAQRVEGELIEEEGFGNFYPTFSPDGTKLAYVTTKDRDYFALSALVVYDFATRQKKQIVTGVRSTLSFSPDGRYLYYSKTTHANPFWSKLSDLYRYDLQEAKEERLTYGARAMNPQLSRDGKQLVFVVQRDGTTNIAVANSDGTNIRRLTNFESGEQVFTPAWSPDGSMIAFGFSRAHSQSLALMESDGANFRIIREGADSRNPAFSPDGEHLYFSSDAGGIFNIVALNLKTGTERQITNVVGGAFLPAVRNDGGLAYALYTSTGYKIAFLGTGAQHQYPVARESLRSFEPNRTTADQDHSNGVQRDLPVKSYRNVFTSLSLFPMVRLDNYNPRNKGFDVVKPGVYFSSVDVVGKFSLFGGAAFNRKFERDLFFILEYRDRVPGLYLLGLDPIVSAEVYNITRKTSNMLDLTPYFVETDVTYNLLEFDLLFKQRIFSERSELTFGYTFSRYSADIGAFINPNDHVLYPSFRSVYLIANTFSAQFRLNDLVPSGESEINPTGRTATFRYAFERNRFNPNGEFEVRNGFLEPVFQDFNFHRVEGAWNEHLSLPIRWHTLSLSARGGSILGPAVDDFFNFYVGGFAGMRGYPFYALGGNEYMTAQLAYRFPIARAINFRVLQFYFTKLYGSVFTDVGMAWNGTPPPLKQWKSDAGFELRLESFSFYVYPTRIFVSGAYGFDRFSRTINNIEVTYGREWRFYLGILFGFELSQMGKGER